ncbi:putative RNA recognition domain-containing protein [Rosellinia necatrix]|uniref:Putative RNA recognition domain-containing protein n=1 Tax=Rosellinia necatrix TaxID=77044 RepID=A0A1S8AAW6_ROSNE|nr:putative RNA recognition domain-containing protein [Rosellinia necatrix]
MAVFSDYGNIIDIVAKTNLKAKGQAFIVFDKQESALQAIERVQGFELFDKPCSSRSPDAQRATVSSTGNQGRVRAAPGGGVSERPRGGGRTEAAQTPGRRRAVSRGEPADEGGARRGPQGRRRPGGHTVVPDEYLPPTRSVRAEPADDYDIEALTGIFGRFEGFREVPSRAGRKGIAFIEYEAEAGAITAKENTAGMAVGDGNKFIKVTYQRQ